ncbi:MAG: minichromosome maintenance protein MCM [Euryarchaeota archaeon]|nr:minichromosome maintenance protein MCM [Euryarchaeota archaeon]
MPEEMTLPQLAKLWRDFIQDYYRKEILEIANSFPEKRSLTVSYKDVELFDPELGAFLLDKPNSAIFAAETAIRDSLPPDVKPEVRRGVHFRVVGLPPKPLALTEVRELRAKHIGKLVAVSGLVRKATQVKPKLVDGVFQCARCLAVIREPQFDSVFKEPLECYRDQGGCGKSAASTRFILLTNDLSLFRKPVQPADAAPPSEGGEPQVPPDAASRDLRSVFIDTQKIEIQESPEDLRGGDQPERLTAYAEDDLCKKISPGDKVVLNGVLRSQQRSTGQVKSTFFDWYLEINSIQLEEHEFEDVEISPEEEERILRLARNKDIYRLIIGSIAPTIYGMEVEKEALALQMFGGVMKVMPDGTRIRGDAHILLVGDPGTAKSQLLRYITRLVPRGIYASGKASTAAGLTAAAVHDEFGEGRWTLEAGALVLADKGLAAVDELDKMSEQDSSSMHEAMEQQMISVAKAGITATLQSRCSILAAANPKEGRFDEHSYLVDQINLSPTLLSRFDVIFPLTDKPDPKKDLALAGHIVNTHLAGEIAMYRKNVQDRKFTKEDEKRAMRKVEPEIVPELLRKYIAYARSRVFPVMTKDVMEILQEYYVNIRSQARSSEGEGGAIPMTPRQIEALIRLSEASARLRLANEVTAEDADRAKRIVEYFLRKVASEGGRFDIDAIMTGTTHVQRERIHTIIDIIEELDEGRGVTEEEVLRRTRSEGIPEDKVKRDLQRLYSDGRVFMPSAERYKVARERR